MSTKKIFIIAIVSLVVILLAIGAVFLLISYKEKSEQNKPVKQYYHDVSEMYCNLKNSNRIVKIQITIEFTNEKLVEELQNKEFAIRHEINTTMVNKTEKDLEGEEGLSALRHELTTKIAKIFNTNEINKVYFKEIIVQ